jgi:hypothetical protein
VPEVPRYQCEIVSQSRRGNEQIKIGKSRSGLLECSSKCREFPQGFEIEANELKLSDQAIELSRSSLGLIPKQDSLINLAVADETAVGPRWLRCRNERNGLRFALEEVDQAITVEQVFHHVGYRRIDCSRR